ncbi:carcinoembryonic antigen-related cell adhesion molecule 5-like [Trichomycterus rosablanca]|uniref:carcinoembryonic antigen-related cell adhesion molecule 5-like n=1 Tax=Trichomycterus rosablanca TaxID=2290929 RepID=UPI002F35A510
MWPFYGCKTAEFQQPHLALICAIIPCGMWATSTFALDLVPLENPVPTGGNLTITLSPATTIHSGSWLYNGLVIVFWYPGNASVDTDYGNRVTYNSATHQLNLGPIAVNDSGEYVLQGITPNLKVSVNVTVVEVIKQVTLTASKTAPVEFTDSVTLNCSATGAVSTYTWYNGSSVIANGSTVQITNNGSLLTITNVTRYDTGPFKCMAANSVSSGTSPTVTLNVSYGPSNVGITASPDQTTYSTKSNITLTCTATSNPAATYSWSLNGTTLNKNTPTLVLNNVTLTNAGTYSCTAKNTATLKSVTISKNISIIDNPWNVTISGPSVVAVKSSVTLNCTASSQPNSTYNWLFNGIKQADGPVYQIASISTNQSGEYNCTVTNNVTGVSSSAKWNLTVLEPITAVSVVPGNTQPIYNTSFSLICNINGPVNTVYWIKNGVDQINTSIISITNQNRNLTLSQLVLSDNGLYQCGASNGLGKMTSEAYNLIVNYGRWNVTISGPIAVVSKSSVTLTCTAASQPPSNISWWFSGVKLVDGPVYQSASVSLNNSGQYTCKADNNVTTSSSNATWNLLVVDDSWNVTISGPSIVAVKSSVTLNCTASSQPNSTYNWLFNGIKQADGPVYQIASISTNQSGEYTCTATNVTGVSSSAKWNLTVLDDSWNVTISGPGVVAVKSSVSLNCTASSQPNSTYNWLFNGIKQADGPVYQIVSISTNQSGEYTCTVTNNVTSVSSSAKWNLTVLEPITAVSVVPGNTQPIYNTSFSLICNINGPVNTVYWIKNGVDQTNTSIISITNQNRNLTLSQLVLSDNGLYQCGASNGLGKMTSEAYNLIVNYGPWNVTISGPTAVVSKSSVTLTCTAASQPPSNISWWFNGVKLVDGPVYQSASVSLNNSGQYTCKADNNVTISSSSATWNLLVVDDFWNVTISGPSVVAVKSSVTLNCTASSQPNSTYNWLFNGIKQADGPVYQIASISTNQSGEYTCTATNVTGVSSSAKWNLTVLEPITAVSVVPGNTQNMNSTSFSLICNITGTANTVYWIKNCVNQTNTSRISITNQNRNLTITQLVLSDNGLYQCGASNGLGKKTSEPFNLNYGSLNLTISGPYIILAKSSVTLNCTASSQPASSYTWLFNGSVVANTSSYKIPSIAANQGGEYTCQAQNSVTGLTGTVKWNLIVIGSPPVHTSVFLVVLCSLILPVFNLLL